MIGSVNIPVREDVTYLILYALLGIALMAGAHALTWVAYGDEPKRDPKT